MEMMSYPFMVRAFLVGSLVALCSALLGVSLVLKRYLYNKEYEPALYEKMKGSIEALSPFIPAKDNADNALPDVFISRQDWENPRDTFASKENSMPAMGALKAADNPALAPQVIRSFSSVFTRLAALENPFAVMAPS